MIYPRFPVLFSPPAARSGEKAATAQPARAESGTASLKAADPPGPADEGPPREKYLQSAFFQVS